MALLFLSYRVATAAQYAGRLYDRLAAHFGEAAMFYDRGSLSPGELWQERLRKALDEAAAVLVIIDPGWPTSFDARAETEDFVRFEVATAIRLHKTIVPLLVGGAALPVGQELPAELRSLLDRQSLIVDDTSAASYAASIATLIGMLEQLKTLLAAVEPSVVHLLLNKDYTGAERLLMRQPAAARQQPSLSVYLALARLAGRSFNALYPAEREAIEGLIRRAFDSSSTWGLPAVLLAILEIDFYQLHGLVSAGGARPGELPGGAIPLDATSRALLSNLHVSRRARHDLRLDAMLAGTVS